MCLTTVTKTYDPPITPKNNIGYVAMIKTNGGNFKSCYWDREKSYRSGFHIWLNKKYAMAWADCHIGDNAVILKIKFKNLLYRGLENFRRKPAIVARDRMILSEVKP